MSSSAPRATRLVLLTAFLIALPMRAEKLVFRDGRTIVIQQPPCLAGDQVQVSVAGLPTPIGYARNFVDEAKTFHSNPQTPVTKLFGPCSASGLVAIGLAPEAAPEPVVPTPAPFRAYSAPSSSSSGGSTHESTSAQCAATTKKGTQCSRRAQSGRAYCYQH